MRIGPTRRELLAGIAAATALARSNSVLAATGLRLGNPSPFSFADLKAAVRQAARAPYAAPKALAPEILDRIDYESWGKIVFNTDDALFARGPGRYPVSFFHLGKFFRKPVAMH